MTEARDLLLSWEVECRERIEMWRNELKDLVGKPDVQALQALKATIDVQVALAELKIKGRQADWAKAMAWAPLVLPMAGVIVGAIIGAWLRR